MPETRLSSRRLLEDLADTVDLLRAGKIVARKGRSAYTV